MPVTTVDIPEELLDFIESLIRDGFAHNRREVILRALEIYAKFQAHTWNGSFIQINGIRKALVSKGSLNELAAGLSESELDEAGRRMGKTLKDMGIQQRIDISLPENHETALKILEREGWGRFAIDNDRITIGSALFPRSLLHGYLETALSVKLHKLETTEDILVFAIEKASTSENSRRQHSSVR